MAKRQRKPRLTDSQSPAAGEGQLDAKAGSHGRAWIPLLLVALTCLALTSSLGPRLAGGDITLVHLPRWTYYHAALQRFRLPLWNDQADFGVPTLALGQTGVLYPGHWLLYGLLPPAKAYTTSLLAHLLLAAWFTYVCGRGFQLCRPAAVLAAVAFVGQGFFMTRLTEPWSYTTGCWLPLAVWAAWRWLKEGSRRCLLALAPILAVQLLAGHFQLAFYTQVTVLLMCLAAAAVHWPQWRLFLPRGLLIPVVIAGALGLAAAQLLPTAELVAWGDCRALDEQYLSSFALHPFHLVSCVAPTLLHRAACWEPMVWDPWRTSARECLLYVGLLPLALALWSVSHSLREARGLVRLWSILLAASVALSLGPNMLGFQQLLLLPGFGWFSAPSRWGIVSGLFLGLLAGYGLQEIDLAAALRLARRFAIVATLFVLMVVGLIIGTASLIGQIGLSAEQGGINMGEIARRELALPAIQLALVAILSRHTWLVSSRSRLVRVVILWTAVDLCLYTAILGSLRFESSQPVSAQSAVMREVTSYNRYRVAGLLEYLPLQFGVAALGSPPIPSMSRYWHQVDRDEISVPRTLQATAAALPRWGEMGFWLGSETLSLNRDAVEFMQLGGIGLLVRQSPAAAQLADERLRRIAEISDPWLARHTGRSEDESRWSLWTPADGRVARAWLFPVGDPPAPGTDPRLARVPPPARRGMLTHAQAVEKVNSIGEQVHVRITAQQPSVLVLSDLHYPGWTAVISSSADRRALDIEPAFGNWRAVRIPAAGKYHITFTFRPLSWRYGCRISLGTLALWLVCCCVALCARR